MSEGHPIVLWKPGNVISVPVANLCISLLIWCDGASHLMNIIMG